MQSPGQCRLWEAEGGKDLNSFVAGLSATFLCNHFFILSMMKRTLLQMGADETFYTIALL